MGTALHKDVAPCCSIDGTLQIRTEGYQGDRCKLVPVAPTAASSQATESHLVLPFSLMNTQNLTLPIEKALFSPSPRLQGQPQFCLLIFFPGRSILLLGILINLCTKK